MATAVLLLYCTRSTVVSRSPRVLRSAGFIVSAAAADASCCASLRSTMHERKRAADDDITDTTHLRCRPRGYWTPLYLRDLDEAAQARATRRMTSAAAMQRKRARSPRQGRGCRRWVLVTSSVALDGSMVVQPFEDCPGILEGSYDAIKRIADSYNVGRTRGTRVQVRKASALESSRHLEVAPQLEPKWSSLSCTVSVTLFVSLATALVFVLRQR